MKDAVESFALAIGKRNEMDKPLVQRLLRSKLQRMNTQRQEIKKLKEEFNV